MSLSLHGKLMAADDPNALIARYMTIQRQHEATLRAVPGVTGIGVGMSKTTPGRVVIFVYLEPGANPEARSQIPPDLDGAPVEVEERQPMQPQ